MYAVWQNENKNKNEEGEEEFPTIKYWSFMNAFCPCCLDQKRRDCVNYVQVSLINALKALGNLRRLLGISDAIKRCGYNAHRNENYLTCPTSLAAFTDAISCPQIEYPTLSSLDGESISLKNKKMIILGLQMKKKLWKKWKVKPMKIAIVIERDPQGRKSLLC